MTVAVRYFSRTGNTCALAYAVAQAVNAEAKDIKCDLEGETDVLFLGSSLYAGNYDASVGAFLDRNADRIGRIVCFGSSASGKSTYAKVRLWAENRGIAVEDKYFNCPGHFLFLHKNRPNEDDLKAAAEFARLVL